MPTWIQAVFAGAAVVFAVGFLCYGTAMLGGMVLALRQREDQVKAMAAVKDAMGHLGKLVETVKPKKEPWEE